MSGCLHKKGLLGDGQQSSIGVHCFLAALLHIGPRNGIEATGQLSKTITARRRLEVQCNKLRT